MLDKVIKKILIRRIRSIYKNSNWTIDVDIDSHPIWVLGMFRSGTSLTSQILMELGLNFGPENDLLQSMGRLKDLNPNGFFENYIFAEYSRYFFTVIGGRGDLIPDEEILKTVSFKNVDLVKLFELSLFNYNDDRITLRNKYLAFKKVASGGLNEYLKKSFHNKPGVKIPMLSHFYPQIIDVWPNSTFLIVFRHPTSVLKSSKVLTDKNSFDLYNDYYSYLLKIKQANCNAFFFSYDHLLSSPNHSIDMLIKYLKLGESKKEQAINLIETAYIRNIPDKNIGDKRTEDIYQKLIELAINVKSV